MSWIVWGIVAVIAVVGLDRILLALESRGLIYYRNNRPVRGVSMYHLNELSQSLSGTSLPVIEEEVTQDEDGDPVKRRSGS